MSDMMNLELVERRKKIVEFCLAKKRLLNKNDLESLDSVQKCDEFFNSLNTQSPVRVVFDYIKKAKRFSEQDFIQYFHARYKALESLLQSHQELSGVVSINRAFQSSEKSVCVIGLVYSKDITKNEHLIFVIEDRTGFVKVLVNKSSPLYSQAKDVMLDEVIGVVGTKGESIIFANNIVHPDIPIGNEFKKATDEVYACVLACVHVGSAKFLSDEFNRFIAWLRGEWGSEVQKSIAKKVKYVFLIGDVVDGVGIYPNQEKELAILDIYDQYREAARLLAQIPHDINLIACPGNHDVGRISEPQFKFLKEFAAPLYELPNLTLVSNPGIVNIHSSRDFSGFNVLMYHGFSYTFLGDYVESIRHSGRSISDRCDLIMKYVLQRRHLAPSHGSNLYVPDSEKDPLVLDVVPDIFFSGHIHKSSKGSYRGVITASGSCFQARTAYQEKFGHDPDPGKVPVLNLQTRQVTMLDFSKVD
jgi:DNA polymerase II small subunit